MLYLASPYQHSDIKIKQERYDEAKAAVAHLLRYGYYCFSPIVYYRPIALEFNLPDDFKFWKTTCLGTLAGCSQLFILTLDGWKESEGIFEEISFAKSVGKLIKFVSPMTYSVSEKEPR